MANKPKKTNENGAELFARWMIEWLTLDEDEFDDLFTCLVKLISLASKHFTNKLRDDYLREIISAHIGDDAVLETELIESTRRILIFCIYKQNNILINGKIDNAKKEEKEKIKAEAEGLDLDAIIKQLPEMIENLCEEFSNTTEEGHVMPNIIDDFVFDRSCLPKGFDEGEYIKKVKTSIGSLTDGEPVYLPAVIGLMIKGGHSDHSKSSFHDEVLEALKGLNSHISYPDEKKDPTVDEVVEKAIEIYKKVYQALKSDDSVKENIFYQDYASVCREVVLNLDRRYPETPNYEKYIVKEYSDKSFSCSSASGVHGGGNGVVGIELPPLSGDGNGSYEIVPENISAVSTIYMAYQLEQLQLIPVADRVVELSMAGLLPYTYDDSMRIIDGYAWSQTERLNDVARYSQYSRALGVSGGQVTHDVIPNNQFSERLRHAVSSIANFALSYDTQKPLNDRSEYVRKSIRDLAANASYYGWAGTYFVAERLKKHIDDAIAILSLEQIQNAYGVNNAWQVDERVAQKEFGIVINVPKHLTLANEGQYLFNLIAEKADLWSGPTGRPLFSIVNKEGNLIEGDLKLDETNRAFRAAQYILAVEGYGDTQVDQYSQPVASTATPSLPSLGALTGGGSTPAFDSSKLQEMRDKAAQGQMPNMNQLLK